MRSDSQQEILRLCRERGIHMVQNNYGHLLAILALWEFGLQHNDALYFKLKALASEPLSAFPAVGTIPTARAPVITTYIELELSRREPSCVDCHEDSQGYERCEYCQREEAGKTPWYCKECGEASPGYDLCLPCHRARVPACRNCAEPCSARARFCRACAYMNEGFAACRCCGRPSFGQPACEDCLRDAYTDQHCSRSCCEALNYGGGFCKDCRTIRG
jgi:hypothetical protein